ncbi:hypothetical protein D046_6184A, partial [Vibrio parahaemolyticus V-223/04]
MRKMRLYAI